MIYFNNVRNMINKKIVVISMLILLLTSTILPVINSQSFNTLNPTIKSSGENNYCDLLIITPAKFKPALQPLVSHKNKFGVKTVLVTLEYIYQDILFANDNAEKVKFFIKKAYDEGGIKYVLLVGGIKKQFSENEVYWCPVRYIHLEDRWGGGITNYDEPRFLTDLYFADIYDSENNFQSWDDDGDGIYGEWFDNNSAEDVLDLYPDVYVGRLPCRNRLEVRNVVRKIINYEKENITGNNWFNRIVAAAGDTYPGGINEGEQEAQDSLDQMPGFSHIKLWASTGNLTGPRDVIKEINKGCGFLLFEGHGSPTCWTTHPTEDFKTDIFGITNYQIPFLFNRNKIPICVINACHNSMFNVSFGHSSWTGPYNIYECISWRFVNKRNGGAIATLGNTGLGYGPKDKLNPELGGCNPVLVKYFFEQYGSNKTDILGEMWGEAISSYLEEYPIMWHENSYNDTSLDAKTVAQWLLIGDPSLKIGGYDPINKNEI